MIFILTALGSSEFKEWSDTLSDAFLKAHIGCFVWNKNGGGEATSQVSQWKRNNMDITRLYFGDGMNANC